VRLPAGPLQGAIGAEFRRDSSTYTPDGQKASLNGQGNLVGSFAALPVAGSFNVKELYSEIQAPLITEHGIDSLTLLLGARGSDYSSVGRVSTEKIGLTFEPGHDSGLRLRGMFQVATRAPSLAELYAAASQSRPGVQDPCDRRFFDGTATTESRCNGTSPVIGLGGTPIIAVNPNSFQALSTLVNAYSTGNPALQPETAHTVTLGMNWKPDYIPNLYASVDYYRIKIDNYISSEFGGAQQIANACFQNGNPDACKILSRDASGNIVIGDPALNQGIQPQNGSSLKTVGEDIYLAYTLPPFRLLGPGRLALALNANHLNSWDYVARDGTTTQCAGVLCAAATSFASQPKWRAMLTTTYKVGDLLTAQWRTRYIGSLSDSLLGGQDYLGTLIGGRIPRIPAFVYHDLMIGFDLGEHLSINGSVSNVFNKQPPVLFDAGSQDNTDVMLYNVIGRYFRLSLEARF
jgi:iron complex outermembrane receptor protein